MIVIDKTRFRLVSMFFVSAMDDVEILFTRNKQGNEDTGVGSTKEHPMIKLPYFLWNQHNLYVIELTSTYLLLLALYSLSVSKRSLHLSS